MTTPTRGRPKGTTRGTGAYLRMYADKALLTLFDARAKRMEITRAELLRHLVEREMGISHD
jgi:hypothetical protein